MGLLNVQDTDGSTDDSATTVIIGAVVGVVVVGVGIAVAVVLVQKAKASSQSAALSPTKASTAPRRPSNAPAPVRHTQVQGGSQGVDTGIISATESGSPTNGDAAKRNAERKARRHRTLF